MNLTRWIKIKGEVLTCPFCQFPLAVNEHNSYVMSGRVGYNCTHCIIPGVKLENDRPYSQYNIGVMFDIPSRDDTIYDQVIFTETFVVNAQGDKWYNVHNNLLKEQTYIVMLEPARKEHFYEGEKVLGMAHVGQPVLFPFIDNWDLTNREAVLNKIKAFLLFS